MLAPREGERLLDWAMGAVVATATALAKIELRLRGCGRLRCLTPNRPVADQAVVPGQVCVRSIW